MHYIPHFLIIQIYHFYDIDIFYLSISNEIDLKNLYSHNEYIVNIRLNYKLSAQDY